MSICLFFVCNICQCHTLQRCLHFFFTKAKHELHPWWFNRQHNNMLVTYTTIRAPIVLWFIWIVLFFNLFGCWISMRRCFHAFITHVSAIWRIFFIILKLKPDVTFIDLTCLKVTISLFIARMAGFSK